MRILNTLKASIAPLAIVSLGACEAEQTIAPPDIRYGEDVCAACGMIISEELFAAAAVLDNEGRYEPVAFDDIGCLFVYEVTHPEEVTVASYVRDVEGGGWLETDEAVYLFSEEIQSPMAFGIAAYESRQAATAAQADLSGEILDFEGVGRHMEQTPILRRYLQSTD